MRNGSLLKNGEISEKTIQKQVIHYCRLVPKISKIVMHFANEGKRSARYGKELKDMGMRPGVSDLFVAKMSRGYGGAWIELKSKNGRLSPFQINFLDDMKNEGYYTAVCRSFDECIDIINWYCKI